MAPRAFLLLAAAGTAATATTTTTSTTTSSTSHARGLTDVAEAEAAAAAPTGRYVDLARLQSGGAAVATEAPRPTVTVEHPQPQQSKSPATTNKVILLVINMSGLGIFGADRCYLGQPCCGCLKGITLGGFLLWAVLDELLIAWSSLMSYDSMDTLSTHVDFDPASVQGAF